MEEKELLKSVNKDFIRIKRMAADMRAQAQELKVKIMEMNNLLESQAECIFRFALAAQEDLQEGWDDE